MAVVVLVHGTTAGGWVWQVITPQLVAAGHTVYTPTLTGLGERVHLATPATDLDMHIADIVNVLVFEDLQHVVLAGHSYGGMVIRGVADRVPERIARLVYLDALVPHDGESLLDISAPQSRAEVTERVQREGEGWLIPVSRGADDVPTRNTPHPFKTWTQPLRLHNPAPLTMPQVYVRYAADKGAGMYFAGAMEISWQRAQAAGWPLYEVDTIHQITPDPQPKAANLLTVLAEHVANS